MVHPQLGVTSFMFSSALPPFRTMKSWEIGSVSITSPKLKAVSGMEIEGTSKEAVVGEATAFANTSSKLTSVSGIEIEGTSEEAVVADEASAAQAEPVPKLQIKTQQTHNPANRFIEKKFPRKLL
jgi:hypothetical protein